MAQCQVEEGQRLYRDLQYAEAPAYGEKQPLCLDLALPKGQGPFPCVVFCHGGRWLHGHHERFLQMPWRHFLNKLGWAVASVQYRFLQEAAWPASSCDLRCAVRCMKEHAPQLKLKPELFVAMGHSAGGQLVGLLPSEDSFLDGDLRSVSAESSSHVKGIIAVAGAWMGPRNAHLGNVFESVTSSWPATLVLHGTEDPLLEPQLAEDFVRKLTELGVDAQLLLLEGHNHDVNPVPPEAFQAVRDFLARIEDSK